MGGTAEDSESVAPTIRVRSTERQRRAFLRSSAIFAGAAAFFVILSRPWVAGWPGGSRGWFVALALLAAVAGVRYLRMAYGWTVVTATEIRTSRLLRGRRIRRSEIQSIETKVFSGRGDSHLSVLVVHTTGRRRYELPAPRTVYRSDADFAEAATMLRHWLDHGI